MSIKDLKGLVELAEQVVKQAEIEDNKAYFPGSTAEDVKKVLDNVRTTNEHMRKTIGIATGAAEAMSDLTDQQLGDLLGPLRERTKRLEKALLTKTFAPRAPVSPRTASSGKGHFFRDSVQAAVDLLPSQSGFRAPLQSAIALCHRSGSKKDDAAALAGAEKWSGSTLAVLARHATALAKNRTQSREDDLQKQKLGHSLKAELTRSMELCYSIALMVSPVNESLEKFSREQVEGARDTLERGRDLVIAEVAVRKFAHTSRKAPGTKVRKASVSPGSAKRRRMSSVGGCSWAQGLKG
jgi:hypothetical protein